MDIPGGFGSTFIGGLFSAMLYGMTTLQTYAYCMHYSEDASAIKFLVAAIRILDTLHVLFMCHTLQYYLITNYGVPTSWEYIVWSFSASSLVNGLVVFVVQCFFSRQIYYLCRPQIRCFVNHKHTVPQVYAVTLSMAAAAIAEVLIAVSLCVLFYDGSSHSAFPRTKRLLNTLIIYAVNRCLLTLLVTLAELVTTVVNQDTWAVGLDFTIGKLYANSLLASLNSREYLRSQDAGTLSDLCISAIHFANPPKFLGDVESFKDGGRRFDGPEMAVIDTTTDSA
ncbi:hypothetical protein M404DRAFT_996560 [Pisolithus tinctorius Marx 270]|uniref:DUF6534 domain-containing protein n=1 Tax=Pisolithus tinctorius Marx 270 TaxID=870435 RepID=A0A0C3PMY0_PISTI|nr:hypothetical protein M404DRAFT_996560 [Pisolithus tinctorius Marx 270]